MTMVTFAKDMAKRVLGPARLADRRLQKNLQTGEVELRLIPAICDRSKDFLDVGANNGIYSYYAKGRARHVWAVEAHPGLTRNLEAILGSEGTVLPLAVSDSTGSATLMVPTTRGVDIVTRSSLDPDANPGFALREFEVPMKTIDSLALTSVGAVKVDVEGHELAVVRGARDLFRTSRPIAIIECEERHHAGGVARLFEFFEQLDYRPYFVHRGRLRQGAEFTVDGLQDPARAKSPQGGRSPDYINNFVFVHKDDAAGLAKVQSVFPPFERAIPLTASSDADLSLVSTSAA